MMKAKRAIVIAGLFLAACAPADQTETAEKASGDDVIPEVVIRTKPEVA